MSGFTDPAEDSALTSATIRAALNRAAPVGSTAAYILSTPPTGWVMSDGTTIGNASSNATGRANADTEDLFTLLWDNYTNTELVIQDSTGTPTTRGISAAADFAANKRMPTPTRKAGTLINVQTFTSNGTYTPTGGMRYCIVELVGGGGGGGACTAAQNAAAGGGAGGYSRRLLTAAQIGTSKAVTIGAAGSAGTGGTGNGGNGGASDLGGTLVNGAGGSGGTNAGAGGAGGAGTNGDINIAGGDGSSTLSGTPSGANNAGGSGGTSFFGGGGKGGPAGTAGSNGVAYGSGGGGAASTGPDSDGGAGAAGFMIISEYGGNEIIKL